MAKYEAHLKGKFDALLAHIERNVIESSVTISREAGSAHEMDGVRCAVRVYERYSYTGGNRLSLCVTVFGKDDDLHLIAVTAGGSQAMFFKINTFGENAFLQKLIHAVETFRP